MLTIDGSMGEGGGQILRSSLALSLCLGRAFRIIHIRARRDRPGLRRQHLAAVRAAAEISGAEVEGAAIGSLELTFAPGPVKPGDYRFAMETAGSTTLVLQTVLPALMTADGPSVVTLEGGTHNPNAPPVDFLAQTYVPLIRRMGPKVDIRLERYGFYPAGGGRFSAAIEPSRALRPIALLERGKILQQHARALVARLPRHIGERELGVLRRDLRLPDEALELREVTDSQGPGNAVTLSIRAEHVTEVFTAFGQRGVTAEAVAAELVRVARRYLAAGVPVGEHLADQLLLPFALAGGGAYLTLAPTQHTLTNMEVVRRFLDVVIKAEQVGEGVWRIEVGG